MDGNPHDRPPKALNSLLPARALPTEFEPSSVRIRDGGPGCRLARTKGR